MFTGLVELKGALARRARRGPGYRLVVESGLWLETASQARRFLEVSRSDAAAASEAGLREALQRAGYEHEAHGKP